MQKIFKMLSIYKGLHKSIYVLFIARIVNSIGNFVYPFLTMFLTEKLGMSAAKAGMFILLVGLGFIPGSLLGGKLTDLFGRKWIMITGQFFSGLVFLSCAFLGNSMAIPWLIFLANFFLGLTQPATIAMAMDLSEPENRKAVFSLIYLGHNIGFAIGPMIAGFLFNNHLPWLFIGDAATTFIAIVMVLFFVKESKPSKERIEAGFQDRSSERSEKGGLLNVVFKRPFLLAFILIATLINFVYSQVTFSLPIHMMDLFFGVGPKLFGSMMAFNAVVVIFFTVPIIALLKKTAPLLNVCLCAFLYALGFGMIFLLNQPFLFFISTFIWTIGEIVGATNIDVYIANHTPISHRGRFTSIVPVLMGIGHITGPVVMGRFIERHSVRMVWPLVGCLALIGAGALFLLYVFEAKQKTKKQKDQS